jgi:hypothetical protein
VVVDIVAFADIVVGELDFQRKHQILLSQRRVLGSQSLRTHHQLPALELELLRNRIHSMLLVPLLNEK